MAACCHKEIVVLSRYRCVYYWTNNVNHDEIDVYIQISLLSSLSTRFLHLNKLNQVLCTNPGLVMVQHTLRAQVLQAVDVIIYLFLLTLENALL